MPKGASMKRAAGAAVFERIEKRLKSYKESHPEFDDILELFGRLVALQASSLEETSVELPGDASLKARPEEGFPVVGRANFPLDIERAEELFIRLLDELAGVNETLEKITGRIGRGMEEGLLDFEGLARSYLDERYDAIEEAAERIQANPWALTVFVKSAMNPSIVMVSENAAALLPERDWLECYCPICGSRPAVGLHSYELEGKRLGVCSFCGHTWRMERICCPFCENRDQEKLTYFFKEDDPARRVYVCKACHGYLKVFEEKDLPQWLEPILEDLVTAYLDEAAENEAYRRPGPRFLGI